MRALRSVALPVVAVAVLAAASSPWIGQWLPRFAVPAIAVAGALIAIATLIRELARVVSQRRLRLVRLGTSLVATVFLAVFPLTHLVRAMTDPGDGTPRVLTGFGDRLGAEGFPLPRSHRGLDVAGRIGDDVIGAAGGRATVARDDHDSCGLMVVIAHGPGEYRTVYCHLSAIAVAAGDQVVRGQRIGAIGTSGQRALPGFEHVHFELQRGRVVEDPRSRLVGCFDAAHAYPDDRLVLTYPVRCGAPRVPPPSGR